MPSIITDYRSGVLDGSYILPPICYPDGNYYLKLGHGNHFEKEVRTIEELEAWYATRTGDPEAVNTLAAFLQSLLPGLVVEEVRGGCCVTSKTPTKEAPYIDEASPGLVVAAGGCGYAAKSCDEIGRVAAVLAVEGRWDGGQVDREACRLRFTDN